jgi:pyridinium-3,5-bisthiocarboxylic acid mononucleotide nickel chelatase
MPILYLDLISGISGDMFVGAMVDLGVDAGRLESELSKLKLQGYHLHVSRGQKGSIAGTKFDVHVSSDHHHMVHEPESPKSEHGSHYGHSHEHQHSAGASHEHEHEHGRDFATIKALIAASSLSAWVKQKSIAVFERIAIAEGKIHGLPPDRVHFHEVGAIDSIVDIVGVCIALELLGKPNLLASRVVEGTGWIECAHGRFPIPAPATLAILGARGIPVSQCEEPQELVTPTGAALLAELVEQFGPMQDLVASRIGFGLGTRDNVTRPNVLRAILGESSGPPPAHDWETDAVMVLETNLDDISAEVLGNFVEKALASGALDVFHTPIQMKKNRPGVLLTLLCASNDADKFSELILRETTSFGVRRYVAERRKLQREFITVQTPFGPVTVKIGRLDGKVIQAAPEFESCRQVAAEADVPLKQVYEAARKAI